MKKGKAKIKPAIAKGPVRAAKARKPATRTAQAKPSSQGAAEARQTLNQDFLGAALADLVQIAADQRELLTDIRDLLAERKEEEQPEEGVEAVVIAEAENPEDLE